LSVARRLPHRPSFPERMAPDFAEFLEPWGLAHFDWPGVGNCFTSADAARALRLLHDALAPRFRAPVVRCVKTANSLIYQIRRPFPPVHLINMGPLMSVAEWAPRVWGWVMALWGWARHTGGGNHSGRARQLCCRAGRISAPGFGKGWGQARRGGGSWHAGRRSGRSCGPSARQSWSSKEALRETTRSEKRSSGGEMASSLRNHGRMA
jgi:hypothetical protein